MAHARPTAVAASLVTAVVLVAAALTGAAFAQRPAAADSRPLGHDVSAYQKDIDWPAARAKGARFVYVKATESHTYRNPLFRGQYDGARQAGLLRGAYHFALPNASTGGTQARYFLRNGGRWTADGRTLPPALDIEPDPYHKGKPCYGLGRTAMTDWIRAFSDEVHHATGRRPVIYTTTHWWNDCTGGDRSFGATHPLWLASRQGSPGPLPAGWSALSLWQYATSGPLPGDQDRWQGSSAELMKFATG